jgi:hypothetical protein
MQFFSGATAREAGSRTDSRAQDELREKLAASVPFE